MRSERLKRKPLATQGNATAKATSVATYGAGEFFGEDVAVDPVEDGEGFGCGAREESGVFGVEFLNFGGGEFAANCAARSNAASPCFASEGNRLIVDEEAGDVKIFADPRGVGRYVAAQVRGGPIGVVFENEIFALLRDGVASREPCEMASLPSLEGRLRLNPLLVVVCAGHSKPALRAQHRERTKIVRGSSLKGIQLSQPLLFLAGRLVLVRF